MKQLRKLHLLSEKYHRILGSVAEKLNAQMGLEERKMENLLFCVPQSYIYTETAVIDQIEGCKSSNLCKYPTEISIIEGKFLKLRGAI